jgi:uncharacterized protein
VTAFVDTSVIMFAAGAEHPRRAGCRAVLAAVAAGRLDAVISAEVVQEILHRFSRSDREVGSRMAHAAIGLFAPVVALDHPAIAEAVRRYSFSPLLARDLVHVATCQVLGIEEIISVDADFDAVEGLRRIDPDEYRGHSGG